MYPLISVVLPAKNEQGNIGQLIEELHVALTGNVEFEILVIDDGSTDNTVEEALRAGQACIAEEFCQQQVAHGSHTPLPSSRKSRVSVLSHPVSCGQSTAIHTGISHARGEWIVTADSDGQNDPADIPALLKLAHQCQAPHFCIAGYRQKRLDTSWVRFQSKVANAIRQTILRDGVPDSGCGLKLFPKQTFLALPYFDHMHRFLPCLIKRLSGEIVVCPVNHRNRVAGKSNYNAWNRAWAGIIDLMGVLWLRKRTKYPPSVTLHTGQMSDE